MKFLEKIRNYIRISRFAPIGRRYFIKNAFDGAMTTLGIVVGAYVAGDPKPFFIISAGLGAALAMGLSGLVGAYVTEEAERTRELESLERSMLKDLEKSVIGKASRFASIYAGIVDGLSPALAAIVCLAPFFLFSIISAIQLSIAITLLVLFLLGAFLGKISSRNMLLHGIKLLCVGLVLTLILLVFKSIG
ncbi:MAG: VIT1/CCC1 transporter family protein [Candidatus Bathyarchaeia archaeon]